MAFIKYKNTAKVDRFIVWIQLRVSIGVLIIAIK